MSAAERDAAEDRAARARLGAAVIVLEPSARQVKRNRRQPSKWAELVRGTAAQSWEREERRKRLSV